MFGWDQPLQSFYLQVHEPHRPEDEQIVEWYGTGKTKLYEVEDLFLVAKKEGLFIDHEMRVKLYGEKDDGS